ncbi:MAG: efflux RND transporter periplasmic adaptor subunit [Methylococcales bacterium]|nr:efflux RND transporter periplasmic adaptor subunit [Methylococcales bacterium]
MIKAKPENPATIEAILGLGDPNDRRGFFRKRWPWLLVAAIIVAVAVFLFIKARQPKPVQYQTEAVKRGDLVVTVSATGTLAPVKEVQVGIEVSGTIKSVLVDYNDRVKVGQVLAVLDTTRLEAQAQQSASALASARAKVKQAEATLQEAQVKMARLDEVRVLSGGKVPSSYDLDTAKATLARAKADLASAKAVVEQAAGAWNVNRTDITKAVVHSPINGVVLERSVEPGQTLASQFQAPVLFKLAEDLTKMELQVDVDEADVGVVHEGQTATFTVDAYPERTFPATITKVRYGPQTVDGVVTYKTVLTVDNSSLSLRPGMTATALVTVNKKDQVLLLGNAVLRFAPPEIETAEKKSAGLLGAMLPRPPRTDKKNKGDEPAGKSQQVWKLGAQGLEPITITKGLSDGIFTEIVSGDVTEGTALVTGIVVEK